MFASPLKDAVIVLVIVLLFFGPKRLPALSRAIGESVKEFKGGIGQHGGGADEKSELPSNTTSDTGTAGNTSEDAPTSATSEHTNA